MTAQEKAIQKIRNQSTATLVTTFELTEDRTGEEIPLVRGWIMDELERRNPIAFDQWIDSNQGPRNFYLEV